MTGSKLSHEVIVQILRTRMSFRQALQRMLKRNNMEMTFEMLQVMNGLWEHEGVSQQYLAEKTAKDKACMTNLMNNLEKKGWIVRRKDENDRRNSLVYFTPEGREMANHLILVIRELHTRIAKRVGNELLMNCLEELKKLDDVLDEL